MARHRKGWDSLSPSYRRRLSRNGITRARYERGHKLDVARGHGGTPEHGLREARRNPVKYRDYIRKKIQPPSIGQRSPEDIAREMNQTLDLAYYNVRRRLGNYLKYNDATVKSNIYGGITEQSGEVSGMSFAEARWTAAADTEELRSRARQQYQGNPWFYH